MNDSSNFLLDLAGAVSDGAPVDWAALSQRADADATRELLEEMAILARVGDVHRTSGPLRSAAELTPLRTWGPLTLLERIGEGAFGEVFRARDNRLDREVALKLLRPVGPDQAVPDAAATIEEGRLLARVRHPNVVTVHGAERVDGRIGIWTEFIDGHTLGALVAERGPMPAEDVVAVGLDLCRALAAVHDAGLLHRDIKAHNVMRETGGRVVLMDFGTGHDLGTVATRAGDLSGTPLYLAPELYAGGQATRQSDIYALAVLLFYLLTGRYPVAGRTLGDLVERHRAGRTSTLHDLRPDLPEALVAAIEGGLSPDPSQRYDRAADFASSLELSRQAPEPTPNATSRAPSRRPRIAVGVVTLVVVGASVVGFGLVRRRDAVTPDSARAAPFALDVRPLTFTGDVGAATISHDGKVVAFLRNTRSLWIRYLDSGVERQVVPPEAAREMFGLTFTPDGASVDICERGSGPIDLLRVPLSGKDPWTIAAGARSAPGWSPDGKRMAFIAGSTTGGIESSRVVLADADGSNARELASLRKPKTFVNEASPVFPATARPAWSPDGRTIAVAGLNTAPPNAWATVILIDVATGAQREIAATEQFVGSTPAIIEVAWIDQTRLAVNRMAVPDGPYQIWTLDSQTGAFSPVTRDLASYKGLSIASDRQALVSTLTEDRQGIWAGGPAGENMSVVIPESSARPGLASFDTQGDFVYSAVTTSGSAVWLLRAGARTPRFIALGTNPHLTTQGDVIFFADVSHHPGLDRVDIDGSHLAQLVSGDFGDMTTVTPDDSTAIFVDDRSGLQSIWTVGLAGGVPRELIHRFAVTPSVSRDGRQLLFGSDDATTRTHGVIVVCDFPACRHARELPRPRGFTADHMWTPDGRGIAFARELGVNKAENIWVLPLDGGTLRQLTHFADGRVITDFAWSPDGKRLVVSRATRSSDLVWMSRVK